MVTILPRDAENIPLNALRYKDNSAHSIDVTAISTQNATAFDAQTKIVSLYATGPVFLRFGDNSVSAALTDHYFPAGVYCDVSIGGGKTAHDTHVAVVAADYDCKLYISERE